MCACVANAICGNRFVSPTDVHVVRGKSWHRVRHSARCPRAFFGERRSHVRWVGGRHAVCRGPRHEWGTGYPWPFSKRSGVCGRPRNCRVSYWNLKWRPVHRGETAWRISRSNDLCFDIKKPKWAKAPSRFGADTLTRAVKPRCSTNHILEFHPVVVKAPGLRFPNHRRGDSHGNRQHAPNA